MYLILIYLFYTFVKKNFVMNNGKLYHIHNLGQKIIFRLEEDYISAINRLASSAYSTQTEVWAYAIMSTHFHLVIRTNDIDTFVTQYKRNISMRHNKEYHTSIQIKVFYRELVNYNQIINAVNYVLKNPIHHSITDSAFAYPYSSCHLYFSGKIYCSDYFLGERTKQTKIEMYSDLSSHQRQKLFGSRLLPYDYKIIDGKMIQPECFVKVDLIERLYQTFRKYLYNISKALVEETEEFAINAESPHSLFGKLSDIEVCRLIDEKIAPNSYAQISSQNLDNLWLYLKKLGVERMQFIRAV